MGILGRNALCVFLGISTLGVGSCCGWRLPAEQIAAIREERNRVLRLALELKRNCETGTDGCKVTQSRYDDAAGKCNAVVDYLADCIRSNKRPSKQELRKKAADCVGKIREFETHTKPRSPAGAEQRNSPAYVPRAFQGTADKKEDRWIEIAKLFLEVGEKIAKLVGHFQKKCAEDRERSRKEMLAELDKLRWESFSDIKVNSSAFRDSQSHTPAIRANRR